MNREPNRDRVKRTSDPRQAGNTPSQKRVLTPEERRRREKARREALLRAEEEKARRKRLRRARRKELFRRSFATGLAFFILYWASAAVSIATRSEGGEDALPLYLYTEGERKEDVKLSAEEVVIGGAVYLPLQYLENYMAISRFGDYASRSFLLCESGEYATFYPGTPQALINGIKVNLKENVVLKDGELYLPIDFYTDKMNCFTFAESIPLAANVLTYVSSVEPGMRFVPEGESAPVDVSTAPAPVPAA